MKAVRINTGREIAPFGDPVGQSLVGSVRLAAWQELALAAAGVTLVNEAPSGEPYLVFSDRTWFSAELIRRMCAASRLGQLQIDHEGWWAWTGMLQELSAPGCYELAVCEGPFSGFDEMESLVLDLAFEPLNLDEMHPAVAHAHQHPVIVGAAMVLQVDHWLHIIRVNQLVLALRLATERLRWENAGFFVRLFRVLGILFRARSINGAKIAKSLNERGRDVEIHPSAVVELCVLGDGVKIGPNAVVRGSILGAGARVDPFATVNASVMGAGARIGRYAFCNLCTVYPGAMISQGDGYQVSVFGEDAFIAWGATALDLSFGKTVKVERDGPNSERVDSGHHFVGVAIGHRAVIGNNVRLRFGVSVPNDGMLVDQGDALLRSWGEAPVGEPVVIQDGHAALPKPRLRPEKGI